MSENATLCNALYDFYTALGGPGWTNASGWAAAATGVPTSYTTFAGLTWSAGNLTGLKATANNLAGTLPSSVGLLTTSLTSLMLGDGSSSSVTNGNDICGSIPVAVATKCKALGPTACSLYYFVSGATQVQFGLKSCTPVAGTNFTCLDTDDPDQCAVMADFYNIMKVTNGINAMPVTGAYLANYASGFPGVGAAKLSQPVNGICDVPRFSVRCPRAIRDRPID